MIETVHLFPELDRQLLSLLRSLKPEDWRRPTIARKWTVKDIAAHLLDGNLRSLSIARDGHLVPPNRDLETYQDLLVYLNELNASWTKAFERVSPALLIELLDITGKQYCDYLKSLDPNGQAIFAVAWAGETQSKNWFHIAREYTEKWHHQKQIRDAVGINGLMTRELFYPFIDTLMMGMPHNLRDFSLPEDSSIRIAIDSEIGGDWLFTRKQDRWVRNRDGHTNVNASVTIQPEDAWKLFTKGKRPEDLQENLQISGDRKLVFAALSMIAVMA